MSHQFYMMSTQDRAQASTDTVDFIGFATVKQLKVFTYHPHTWRCYNALCIGVGQGAMLYQVLTGQYASHINAI